MVSSGVQPLAIELMDGKTLEIVDAVTGTQHAHRGQALLLIQTDGLESTLEMEIVAEAVARFTSESITTTNPAEAELWMKARRDAIPALETLGHAQVGDVGVPRMALADMMHQIHEISARHSIKIYTVGHAGDLNLYPIILIPLDAGIDAEPVKRVLNDIFAAAKKLGGTLTGEDGVGLLKRY